MELLNAAVYALTAVTLTVSLRFALQCKKIADQTMKDWAHRGPHDPQVEAAVRARLSRGDNKRLTRYMQQTRR